MARSARGTDRRFTLDLATHLTDISTPPHLGPDWLCEVAAVRADEAAIGGDFVVFSRTGDVLRLMLVDTSGKGAEAATRAVMLAGAVAGLLGELALDQVLPAVNRHVSRVGDAENFATAVLLEVDLETGTFSLGNAGHPPAAQFLAGSGTWQEYPTTGPALGFFTDASWDLHSAKLETLDSLLIVTDGVIEVPGSDIDRGLDRLLGQAHELVLRGWAGGADQLLGKRRLTGDDAQVFLLHRQRPAVT